MKNVIAGTAGHIDHGKTALIQALTGIDADRLKEEKLRGITIDLGFAHLLLPDLQIGFIDVPGHERFIHNMLAGIGGIDLVMLIVSAEESVMPQTREHFEICKLLGIRQGLVVVTKIDLIDEDMAELVESEVRELVQGSFLENAPLLRVSSKTGRGIEELQQQIKSLALAVPQRSAARATRLPVDRVFTVKGFGTVVTGTLLSGTLQRDQEVEFLPEFKSGRIRNLHTYGQQVSAVAAGQRVAVNIQGLEVAELHRGMTLAEKGFFSPSSLLDVRMDLLAEAPAPLKHLSRVHLHIGAHELLARVALFEGDFLTPGSSACAQLRLEEPALAAWGDRFIVRRYSPLVTIGGGMVLHSHPPKLRRPSADRPTADPRFEEPDDQRLLMMDIDWAGIEGRSAQQIYAAFGFSPDHLRQLTASLEAEGTVAVIWRTPLRVVSRRHLREVQNAVLKSLDEYHRKNPLSPGLAKEELRQRLGGDRNAELFSFLMQELAAGRKIDLQGEVVALHGRTVTLSADELALRQRLEELFLSARLQPPTTSEALGQFSQQAATARNFYHLMLKEGRLVKVSEELTLHATAMGDLKLRLKGAFLPGKPFNVGQFKDLFGLTRKYAIPILEYLDRQRITRRVGDDRVVL